MALISCPECNSEVSDKAIICPQCGFPIEKYINEQRRDKLESNEQEINIENEDKKSITSCKYCNATVKINDEYCDECGMRLKEYNYKDNLQFKVVDNYQNKVKKSESSIKKNNGYLMIALWIFFLPVMAIITIEKSEKLSKKAKILLSSVIILFTISFIVSINDNKKNKAEATFNNIKLMVENKDYVNAEKEIDNFLDNHPTSEYVPKIQEMQKIVGDEVDKIKIAESEAKAAEEAQAKAESEALAKAEEKAKIKEAYQKNIDIIMEATTLIESEAEQVFNDLKSVGFSSITECAPALGTGVDELQSFTAVADYKKIFFTIEKRKTYYIGYGSNALFDASKDGVLIQIQDLVLDEMETGDFIFYAMEYVKSSLITPSTAKFPGRLLETDQWSVGRYKNVVEVSSYVDSQNSFGALIRSEFIVQMDYDSFECTYLEIEGQKVGTRFTPPN